MQNTQNFNQQKKMNWEEAFFSQYHDACIGRLFRGIIHNLNGVNQTFTLQAALLNSMFLQADQLLKESYAGGSQGQEALSKLQYLLDKRFTMVGQMQEKVTICENIVQRTLPLRYLYDASDKYNSITKIVDLEFEILTADSFFKHKVTKNIDLAEDLPKLKQHAIELHTIIFCLLNNAKDAVLEISEPVIDLRIFCDKNTLHINLVDNGCGIKPEFKEKIFDPFLSTNPEKIGVGLYLTKKAVDAMNGNIEFKSKDGETSFQIALPVKGL